MCAPLYAVFISYLFILTDFTLMSENPALYQYLVGGILFSFAILTYILYRIESGRKDRSNRGGKKVMEIWR